MRTWEMIKKLTENPSKKFKRVGDGLEVSVDIDNCLLWKSGHSPFNINHVWEEVKELVSFIEAITSGKKVSVECAIETYEWKGKLRGIYHRQPNEMLRTLASYGDEIAIDIILNGDWYIED